MLETKEALYKAFPEKLQRLLGQELTEEGLTLLHEMLQNRIVVKSLVYVILDKLWLSIFPDLDDFLSGSTISTVN